ncbi:MAG TPA: cupin domain-containing protein [Ignavibacteria bacterium]|nr:cupin domain-containing protein [Ignavibacteria bacterium]
MKRNAGYWIENLNMLPHPEGGFYKESYRSDESISKEHLPERYNDVRNFGTAIYYLLENDQTSKLHRLKSDEMFHFYDGSGMIIYVIGEKGKLSIIKLGLDIEEGENPQILLKAGVWFGAKVSEENSYCLAGCTVSPGFHFDDFEMGRRSELISLYPEHKKIIEELTN